MSPELVSLLNSYPLPAGICDRTGNWIALNGKLQRLLGPDLRNGLADYLPEGSHWRDTWRQVLDSRRLTLTDTRFTGPLADRLAETTRIDFLNWDKTSFLVEFPLRAGLAPQAEPHREREEARDAPLRGGIWRRFSGALTDPLTGVANRSAFERQLTHQWNLALCQRTALSLLIITVDLPPAADSLNLSYRDAVMQKVSTCLLTGVGRWSDFVARVGEHRFGIVLPGTDASGAETLVERLRNNIGQMQIVHPATRKVGRPIVSISCHNCRPTPDGGPEQLFRHVRSDTKMPVAAVNE